MVVAPRSSRSVYISMLTNGCCHTGFDSTYPNKLHGIINNEEFQQSLNNVNKSIHSIILIIMCIILPFLCIFGGGGVLITGAVMSKDSNTNTSVLLLAIGGGILGFGLISLIIGHFITQAIRTSRMRQKVAEESAKYSNRLPIPCTWRLDVSTMIFRGAKGNTSSRRIYTLVITIGDCGADFRNGNFSKGSNQISLQQSSSQFTQQDPSPIYYGHELTSKFCSQCGMPRQTQMAKFCVQCGQSFNR
ncbi:unnamed protein product [Adineta steineri]|uniref:Uncharacterized protein n=1 Tax=Adineta steineri TaxID=433720 RepID=A0A815Q855_9BILA|nr:unnamed protein product [Adineta steineri]CAF3730444.1 unnamed protein product [Adineta steineri]